MAKLGTVFLSECGNYICRSVRWGGHFEAWTIDGSIHWRDDDRYCRTLKLKYLEFPMERAIGGYSAEKTGQKSGSFTLNLLRCDTTKRIEPLTGNTVIESLDVVFRRKVPPQNVPKWIPPMPEVLR